MRHINLHFTYLLYLLMLLLVLGAVEITNPNTHFLFNWSIFSYWLQDVVEPRSNFCESHHVVQELSDIQVFCYLFSGVHVYRRCQDAWYKGPSWCLSQLGSDSQYWHSVSSLSWHSVAIYLLSTFVFRIVLTAVKVNIGSTVSATTSGGSTLGPWGHRPPKSCPGPPNFFQGNLGLTCLHQFILYCTT